MLPCLGDVAYKIYSIGVAYKVAAASFLSGYLRGPLHVHIKYNR